MPTTLTRRALYDLVWAKPRTLLAKELGVSDVAIGKQCAAARVPVPPAGYWARIAAGAKPSRPLLPLRLPGQADSVVFGQEQWKSFYPTLLADGPLEPPGFVEDLEEQVKDAAKRVGRVPATRGLQATDPALSRLLAAEAKRRDKFQESNWSIDQPYFDSPIYQRQLRIFNSLARALSPVYGKQEVRCEDEWVQGFGTLHHLVLVLGFGQASMSLSFLEPSLERRNQGRKKVDATTLSVGTSAAYAGIQEWTDSSDRKLEEQLTEIAEQLLRRAELTLRARTLDHYRDRVARHERALAEEEARRQEAEVKRLAAIEANRLKLCEEVMDLARRRRMAEDIRATVLALMVHPDVQGGASEKFQAWKAHALGVADSMDPMLGPIEGVFGSFSSDGPAPTKDSVR